MSLPEEQSTLEEVSSPIAWKNSGLAVSSVTPSLKKGNSGGDQFIDEDLFVDERKLSSMTVANTHLRKCEHKLIPVTAKMIHSTVNTCKRFVLRDGCLLHMVQLVGPVTNYNENMNKFIIDVEDRTGLMQDIVWHKENECKAALASTHNKCKGNGYVCVIGNVTDYYDVREIIAFAVHPVSSGNKLTYQEPIKLPSPHRINFPICPTVCEKEKR
jgi:hypothetical protein